MGSFMVQVKNEMRKRRARCWDGRAVCNMREKGEGEYKYTDKKICLVLGLLGLLALLNVQLGQGLAGIGKLDAVDDLLASADGSS